MADYMGIKFKKDNETRIDKYKIVIKRLKFTAIDYFS